jgi:hypothetical protein
VPGLQADFHLAMGNSPMFISRVWHNKCNTASIKKSSYEKDHRFKPGGYIAVLFFVAGPPSILMYAAC